MVFSSSSLGPKVMALVGQTAAHAVVESAGGRVIGPDGKTLDYDVVEDLLNPYFLVSSSSQWDEMWVKNQS